MKNILLTIEYDGTGFKGWQRQPEVRTVQGELERVLSYACKEEITINGTSRTDAGVHALGQRATFNMTSGLPVDKLPKVVNNLLCGGMHSLHPVGDVRIVEAREVDADFHARFDSKGKKYRYMVRNTAEPDIFRRNYCYQVTQPLDVEAMQEAAKHIVGTHDFKCFQAAGGEEKETTVRTIYSLDVKREGENVVIEVAGDGFLYNMVRIITGTLVEVGLGKKKPEDLAAIIDSKDRRKAGHTAPAEGLYLVEVYYEQT
ncbi:MAG: tRNA pseudouridine(38-40) synthase TruA [Firmicutes bacterium]|nr:tRNA pseudouridine(38-40) synthase TruA [Bacillota bacterium]